MGLIVPISEAERAAGQVSDATANAAYAAIHNLGCVILRGVYDIPRIDSLKAQFDTEWGVLDEAAMRARSNAPPPNPVLEVGAKRYEILLDLKGEFTRPDLFGNRLLCRFLGPMLAHMKLSGMTVVISYPGAELQHMHRDHALLYTDPGLNAALPPYAINVAVPLVDVDAVTGPTAICLGSHRWPPEREPRIEDLSAVEFLRGDCILIDYRTFHTGLPNQGKNPRPILYMVYTRTWFFDEVNHRARPSLSMSEAEYLALPGPVQQLAERAYSQRLRARYLAAADG
ncbi:MAG: kanJ 2 [Caulobacteraceae bacterium]|nr:kanJ 2 [Caulobacteraceae bacterium]